MNFGNAENMGTMSSAIKDFKGRLFGGGGGGDSSNNKGGIEISEDISNDPSSYYQPQYRMTGGGTSSSSRNYNTNNNRNNNKNDVLYSNYSGGFVQEPYENDFTNKFNEEFRYLFNKKTLSTQNILLYSFYAMIFLFIVYIFYKITSNALDLISFKILNIDSKTVLDNNIPLSLKYSSLNLIMIIIIYYIILNNF